MRLSHSIMLAGALFVAAPALAQDNSAAPADTVAANTSDMNVTADNMAAPVAPVATAPAAQPMANSGYTAPPVEEHHGFPWGVLGLLGLIGLMGVRKVKG